MEVAKKKLLIFFSTPVKSCYLDGISAFAVTKLQLVEMGVSLTHELFMNYLIKEKTIDPNLQSQVKSALLFFSVSSL